MRCYKHISKSIKQRIVISDIELSYWTHRILFVHFCQILLDSHRFWLIKSIKTAAESPRYGIYIYIFIWKPDNNYALLITRRAQTSVHNNTTVRS